MARRPEPESDPYTRAELDELRNNLAKLSGQGVTDFYRDSHRECALERKPSEARDRLEDPEEVGMEVSDVRKRWLS